MDRLRLFSSRIIRFWAAPAIVALVTGYASAADRLPIIKLPELPGPTSFVVPSDAEQAGAATEVRQRLKALETHLAALPIREFVRHSAGLDQLQEILDRSGQPSAADLRPTLDRLGTGADYLDEPKFLQLRQSLVSYQRMLTPLADPAIANLYVDRRDELAHAWTDFQFAGDEAALDRLRQSYAWCVDHRQAQAECAVIRQQLDRGNVFLKLDHDHMALLLPPSARQNVPISTVSDGTTIRGSGILDMKPRLVFLPNSSEGDLQLVLDGTMRASLAASRGRIQAWMTSTAQLASAARVTLDDSTLRLKQQPPARASSWTTAYAVKPPLNLPLIRRVTGPIIQNAVNRQLAENKPQMDAMIAQQMSQIMATEARKTCAQVNRTYDEAFFSHLRRHGINAPMRASTQAKALTVAYAFSDGDLLPGLPLTSAAAPSDLLAHETFLVGIKRMLARKRFDADRFCEAVFETIGLVPGEDSIPARGCLEPTIVLDAEAPLQVRFRDQRLTFEATATSVERDGQTHDGQWKLHADYIITSTQPALVLRRIDAATVMSQSPSEVLSEADAERFFPPTLEFSEYTSPGQMLKSAALAIRGVTLDRGWIRIDFQSATTTTPANSAAKVAAAK